MNEPVKICKDCKYFKINHINAGMYSKCSHPSLSGVHIVSGEIDYVYADIARKYDKYCGVDGKYFEQKVRVFIKAKNWFGLLWRVNGLFLETI